MYRKALLGAAALLPLLQVPMVLADEGERDLLDLSIEELGDIEISSVSKKAEPLSEASAAIYVITGDEILRSGVTSVPEMLRLAPNLEVGRIGSSSYAVSARGFNSNLANKLLVLIDGRSVYTSLFGGVYWDMQDVMREDIERIEVISGPGATLWGANAVNGVINITTRKAADTVGGVIDFGGGNLERAASARYGSSLGDDAAFRVYAKGFHRDAAVNPAGASARDAWSMGQGGFRVDWTPGADVVTLQGDLYRGSEHQPSPIDQAVRGENMLARWQHHFDGGSELQVQAYYDRTQRLDAGGFVMETYDVDVQHSLTLGTWNDVVWGGGYRLNVDHVTNVAAFQIQPVTRSLDLANGFIQDSMSLGNGFKLTLGIKLEDDPYSDVTALPSARLAWKVTDSTLLWAAASRAVRAPTRFDRDVVEKLGTLVFLIGGPNFTSEKLIAYEVGARLQPSSALSFSVSGFYNDYDDLRSTEPNPAGGTFPLRWGNLMAGHVYGVETWASYQVNDRWRLQAGFNAQHENLRFKPGSSALGGLEQAGNDPARQASLRSVMNVTPNLAFDAALRYVSALPKPVVPAYVEFDSGLRWRISDLLEFSVTGNNLLHTTHRDFTTSGINNLVERSFFVETRWSF